MNINPFRQDRRSLPSDPLNLTNAHCTCGINHYAVVGQPLFRFICHCQICQAYSRSTCSDVTVFPAERVIHRALPSTHFKKWRRPPNISRGSCSQCGGAVIEYGLLDKIAFVPVNNLEDKNLLPEPALHMFYEQSVHDIPDAAPKCEGYLQSQLQFAAVLTRQLLQA